MFYLTGYKLQRYIRIPSAILSQWFFLGGGVEGGNRYCWSLGTVYKSSKELLSSLTQLPNSFNQHLKIGFGASLLSVQQHFPIIMIYCSRRGSSRLHKQLGGGTRFDFSPEEGDG